MAPLILTMHTTADGFVATDDGGMWPGFDWPDDAQARLNDLYREADAVVYGRGVYETVVPFWLQVAREGLPEGTPMGAIHEEFAQLMAPLPKYVVSHDLQPPEDGVGAIREDVEQRVADVKAAAGGPVLLLSGGALAGRLAVAGVLDEILLLVGSVAIGDGRPVLDVAEPLPLRLSGAEALPPLCTVMRYTVADALPQPGE